MLRNATVGCRVQRPAGHRWLVLPAKNAKVTGACPRPRAWPAYCLIPGEGGLPTIRRAQGAAMKIGLTSFAFRWAFTAGMPIADFLRRAADAGAEVVQLCENSGVARLGEAGLKKLVC